MTIDVLIEIHQFVDFKNQFQVCAYSAILTGFYLVLRSSNLVPNSTEKFDGREQFM